jgi:hypothetical protein
MIAEMVLPRSFPWEPTGRVVDMNREDSLIDVDKRSGSEKFMSRKRGRPPTFRPRDRRYLAGLIHEHGAHGAKRTSRLEVSLATLRKIAQEFGITLRRGRRPLVQQAA